MAHVDCSFYGPRQEFGHRPPVTKTWWRESGPLPDDINDRNQTMKTTNEPTASEAQLRYLLDRIDILDTIARYSQGQDSHQGSDDNILEQWDEVFTEDSKIDYSVAGAPLGNHRDLARWMRGDKEHPGSMTGSFQNWQHMLSLPVVTIDGDTARARTDFFSTHRGKKEQNINIHYNAPGAFHDELVRTPKGWRIRARRLEVYFGDPLLIASTPEPAIRG